MKKRETVAGLLIAGAFGTLAQGALAQEPWVAPENPSTTVVVPTTPEDNSMIGEKVPADTGTAGKGFDHHVRPPLRAFELQLGFGYGQGFGDIGAGQRSVDDVSGAGGTLQMTLGYRATPRFMIGFYGSGSQFARGGDTLSGTEVRSATAGFEADFHFRPSYVVDPWVSLGTGWRGMWLSPDVGETTSLIGLELARVQVGLDFRVSPEVALSPVFGADASMFLSQNGPLVQGFSNIGDPRVNFFLFGGLQARFDFGGAKGPYYSQSHAPSATF